jgi:hypothetical protein
MTRTKEKIKTVVLKTDGTTVDHTTERMGTVYKKKDGREWAHYKEGYLLVTRVDGVATVQTKMEAAATA